ncbi:hypothetical protein [Mesorhizobium sp. SP-1A]|uniref:hypothetical protein n=1 Tax=Mesorhizobium sp. SP-1A TaxID=3077840 RepID=UPI0028F6E3FC|nr:hypothetical protein [Mesorhizobium sp. SP-1A]
MADAKKPLQDKPAADRQGAAAETSVPPDRRGKMDVGPDGPEISNQNWDELRGAPILPAESIEDGKSPDDTADELPEENDDNPDQASDEALPDDDEERAMRHDLGGSGIRYEPD